MERAGSMVAVGVLVMVRHRLEVALNDLEALAQALFDADDTRRTAASRMPYL